MDSRRKVDFGAGRHQKGERSRKEQIFIAYSSWEVRDRWNENISTGDFKPIESNCCSC
jgi:hypothetical protein